MGAIIGTIGSAIGGFFKGGVVGIAASLIQKWINHRAEIKEKDKEIELARLAVQLAKEKGNADAIVATIQANSAAMAASYEHDTKTLNIGAGIEKFFDGENKNRSIWGYVLYMIAFGLDFIRGSLRPFMCYIYTLFSAAIVIFAYDKGWIAIDVIQRCAEYTVYTWVEISAAIIGWYFGNRNDEKVKRK
jgi:hypothetical protein